MKRVLLIEDDPVLRENTAELLELSEFQVVTASNGNKGVQLAKEHLPDIIICDIMMPELDGYGALQALSQEEQTKQIPFIFLSAKTERKDIRKGMDLGADDPLFRSPLQHRVQCMDMDSQKPAPDIQAHLGDPADVAPIWEALPPDLRPAPPVRQALQQAWDALHAGEQEVARSHLDAAYRQAEALGDRPGQARALAQLASLAEQEGRLDQAWAYGRQAHQMFLTLGDAAGLIQSYRLEGFLHLRQGEVVPGVTALAQALALALQLDPAPVFVTLQQMVAVAGYLVEQDRVADLLPLAAAIQQAVAQVETVHADAMADMADVAELVRTVAGVLAPLGVMAQESALSPEQRRALAARSVHQAWLVDALTRRRWNLTDMVKATLAQRLDFHEPLD